MIIVRFLREYLGFTRNEMLVLALLCAVLVGGSGVRWYRHAFAGSAQGDSTALTMASLDSAFAAGAALFDSLAQSPAPERPLRQPRGTTHPSPGSIEINRATLEQLMQLPGIGPRYAEAILKYRQEQGPFTSVEQLTLVRGIGPKTLEKIRPFVKVD